MSAPFWSMCVAKLCRSPCGPSVPVNCSLRTLLPKDLVSDGGGQHVAGYVPGQSGSGSTASVRSIRDATSDTVASYAISDEQGARKNALDNRQ